MNNYNVVITTPEKQGQVRIVRKHTLDVIALNSTDAGMNAIRSINPQGNFSLTVKSMGVRT